MKKSQLALIGASAALSVAGMVATTQAYAASSCTIGTATTSVTCTLDTGGFLSTAVGFTGSQGVGIGIAESITGFGVCAGHIKGTGNKYGMTTNGGSMTTVTGTTPISANPSATVTGGC